MKTGSLAQQIKQVQELWQKFGKVKDNPYVFSLQNTELVKPALETERLPHEEEITRVQIEERLCPTLSEDDLVRALDYLVQTGELLSDHGRLVCIPGGL